MGKRARKEKKVFTPDTLSKYRAKGHPAQASIRTARQQAVICLGCRLL